MADIMTEQNQEFTIVDEEDVLARFERFKSRVNELGVARADLMSDRVRVTWAEGQTRVKPEAIVRLVMANRDRVRMQPPASLDVMLDTTLAPAARFDAVREMLATLSA